LVEPSLKPRYTIFGHHIT